MTRLRRYEENVELIFKNFYISCSQQEHFCPFIYDSSLQPILVKMVLGVGGILLFLRAADWKHYIRMPGLSWMALFVLSFLLSSFMNRRYGMSENFKWMIWMILQMGCLYTCKLDRSRESYEKEFRILSHVMLGYSMIAAICSFWQLLQGTALKWITQSGEVMLSGYHWGGCGHLYRSKLRCRISCPLYIDGVVLFLECKKWWRYIYLFPMLLSVLYIGFSDSRTSALMLCAGCGAYFSVHSDTVSR
mgnify:CR=1 FL=1